MTKHIDIYEAADLVAPRPADNTSSPVEVFVEGVRIPVAAFAFGARRAEETIASDRAPSRPAPETKRGQLLDWPAERRRVAIGAEASPAPTASGSALASELRWILRLAVGVTLGILLGGMATDALLYTGLWPIAEASF